MQLVKKAQGFVRKDKENKELLVDSVFALGIRGVASVASLIMSVVITRHLGAKEAGYFFLAYTIVSVAAIVTRIGTDNVIMKYVSIHSVKKEWGLAQGALWQMVKWVLLLSSIVGILISLFSSFIALHVFKKPELATPLFWMGFSIPAVAVATGYSNALQGIKRVVASVSLQSVTLPLFVVAGIYILAPKTSGIIGFIYFAASVLALVIGLYWWRIYSSGTMASPYDKKLLWKTSKPLWTQMNARLSVLWGGQFIAGFYLSSDKLSQLAVAQRTSQLVSFILIAVNLVSAPRFAYFYNQNQLQRLKNYAINATRLMTFIAIPFVVVICIWSAQIMAYFGKGFEEGALVLVILSLGQFVNAITGSVSYLLSMSGHEKDNRNIAIINGAFSLILCLVLIPYYGALGAAIATSLGVASQNLMGVYLVKKRLGFSTLAINFNFLKKNGS